MKAMVWRNLAWIFFVCAALLVAGGGGPAGCAGVSAQAPGSKHSLAGVMDRTEVTQYGITWKFDHAVKSGQFVNGDWWVVGPVTVVSVTPGPEKGPLPGEVTVRAAVDEQVKDLKEPMKFIIGFVPPELTKNALDMRMRNGSMVIEKFGLGQGFDSRSLTYDPASSVVYPYKLGAERTLISTISEANPVPESFCHPINWRTEKTERTLLKAAAVLTCLSSEPPADAFRPAYAGTEKIIYRAGDLQWGLLKNLKLEGMEDYFKKPWLNQADPTCEVATWGDFEGYFQRPWLGYYGASDGFGQVLYYMQPAENQPMSATACSGREDTRLVSIASLMVHLDVPRERKEKLLIGMVQRGIDLSGMFHAEKTGRSVWFQSGCKWPVLFASLMLDKPELRTFKEPVPFYEDITTYYGTGWYGQTALWRIVWHDHLIDSCEERAPEQMVGNDGISEAYRSYGSSGKAWLGTALAARLMGAIKIWDHDAFFDYCDRWLSEDPALTAARGVHKQPVWEKSTWDPFVDAMWRKYRESAPQQEGAAENLKSEWEKKAGVWEIRWVANPKPSAEEVAAHVDAIHKAFPAKYPEGAATRP